MRTHRLTENLAYDGSQLRPHWIRRASGLVGDAMVAFRGPCAIREHEMVDLQDLLASSAIAGDDMLHFVWEIFDDGDLGRAVLRQRMLTCIAGDLIRARTPGVDLRRDGDDLFVANGKLSISVATRSLVSTLIHFAINVSNSGTPVETASLTDLDIAPEGFADDLLAAVAHEEESMVEARCQVRPRTESEG